MESQDYTNKQSFIDTPPPMNRDNSLSIIRNLESHGFPPIPPIPSTEEVMDDLRAVTLQYINCADPTESAARKQRVQQSDERGLMEETARSIIETATQNQEIATQQTAQAYAIAVHQATQIQEATIQQTTEAIATEETEVPPPPCQPMRGPSGNQLTKKKSAINTSFPGDIEGEPTGSNGTPNNNNHII
ncbi:hypothetical protein Bca52824_011923 [Brassica carinata]|uniref:Uncharacterized protein n=1 Tax=Brassica carinata TaxID=52824 RepID=A0A8X7VX74_BRACI|nr:hypothetical protein Bca52824_011923 [Brassica carinata]